MNIKTNLIWTLFCQKRVMHCWVENSLSFDGSKKGNNIYKGVKENMLYRGFYLFPSKRLKNEINATIPGNKYICD